MNTTKASAATARLKRMLSALFLVLTLAGVVWSTHLTERATATARTSIPPAADVSTGTPLTPAGQITAHKSLDLFLRPLSALEVADRNRRQSASDGGERTDQHDAAVSCEAVLQAAASRACLRSFAAAALHATTSRRTAHRPRDPPRA